MNANRLRLRPTLKSVLKLAAAPVALAALFPVLAFGLPAQAAGGARFETVRVEPVRWSGGVDGGRYGDRNQERQFSTDALNRLQDRIDWAQSRGALSAREAYGLQDRADDLRNRARAYWRSGGVDRQEARELDDRFQDLREEVRHLVWDREYRGQYRQEWRERSLWGENGWRGDSYSNKPELKGPEFDRDDDAPDLNPPAYSPQSRSVQPPQPAPKKYEAPKTVTPSARPNGGGAAPAQTDRSNQPFQDGRDFH